MVDNIALALLVPIALVAIGAVVLALVAIKEAHRPHVGLQKMRAELAELTDSVNVALELAQKAKNREAVRAHRAKRDDPDPSKSPEEWKAAMRRKLHGNVHNLNVE
jgi:biopolymer transport protein ExbB/TolQ